jgi:hypothetical protein
VDKPQYHPKIVISTGAAHAFVSSGVEKPAFQRTLSTRIQGTHKIKLEKVENFQRPKTGRQPTTFTTQFTTTSPQFHHQKTPLFPKHPSKTPAKSQKILPPTSQKKSRKTRSNRNRIRSR